jgi:glycosyltransferase involved in cell wall biosynthesis
MAGVSVLILTLNEEANLPGCLASVAWSDDVVVLDSGSSDRTIDLARAAGARVYRRRFDDWSSHQNWALTTIAFRNPWVFNIDADERMPPDLAREACRVAALAGPGMAGYYCGRSNLFLGRPIPRAMPPVPVMRLLRPGRVGFRRRVHPVPVLDGTAGYLRGRLLHDNTSRGLGDWIDRHNRYAALEAAEMLDLPDGRAWFQLAAAVLAGRDPAHRRTALKALSGRLPARPLAKFLYLYMLRGGFLDGRAGLAYCLLQAFYELMIVLKAEEISLTAQGGATGAPPCAAGPSPSDRPGPR